MARPIREVPWLGRRSGRYYAYWYDAEARETKRLSLRTDDSGEAQGRFAAFLEEGVFAKPRRDAGLTVTQALEDYRVEHVIPNCADAERQENAITHLKAFFATTQLVDVDIPRSRAYATARRAGIVGGGKRRQTVESRRASDSTIRRELNVLVAASNHAKRWKRTIPGVSVEMPSERRLGQDDEAPCFTRGEIEMLLSLASGDLFHFIVLAYYTGARRASIELLTVKQVRWDQNQILLQRPGKKATKKRQPIVPILDEMRFSLKTLCDQVGHDGHLFHANFYRSFRVLCESIGLGDRSHPHCLRHSRATHLLQAGVSIYDVAKLLGDTIATIDRVYGHHSQDRLVEAIQGK